MAPTLRARNALEQYDDLATEWWDPRGEFAALHWLARARGALIPPGGGVLLDIGCGGGLLAPHVPAGYRHIGVDLGAAGLTVAAEHGVEPVRADAAALPFGDGEFDVVVAGEVLEHVEDLAGVVAEALRVLRPGGTFVCDTLNDTWAARLVLVWIGERVPGGPPLHCHDPRLFVAPGRLRALCALADVELEVWGVRPHARQYLSFLVGRRVDVEMIRTPSLALTYQGRGVKA